MNKKVTLPVSREIGGVLPGVDLDNNASLLDHMGLHEDAKVGIFRGDKALAAAEAMEDEAHARRLSAAE